jgi:ferredoxin--NADP+ reductase
MVATGTGLAPYMSMIRTELACGDGRRFAVIHGARHSWDLGYSSELVTMQRLCYNFSYLPVISRPAEEPVEWGGRTGYVQDLWYNGLFESGLGFKPDPSNTHVFLCGHPAMIEGMLKILVAIGFTEHTKKISGEVHLERYW